MHIEHITLADMVHIIWANRIGLMFIAIDAFGLCAVAAAADIGSLSWSLTHTHIEHRCVCVY